MLFSVGVFLHSKQVFSNLSTFLNMTALYTYLDLILCIHHIYTGGFWKNHRAIWGECIWNAWCLSKCLPRNFGLVEGVRGPAKHPQAVHMHPALLCASDKSCRRKCQKGETRLRKQETLPCSDLYQLTLQEQRSQSTCRE